MSGSDAEIYCREYFDSHLATITTIGDTHRVTNLLTENSALHSAIGLNDIISEGKWEWMDGTPCNYSYIPINGSCINDTRWAKGEPQNLGPAGEHCSSIFNHGEMVDIPCDERRYSFLCNNNDNYTYTTTHNDKFSYLKFGIQIISTTTKAVRLRLYYDIGIFECDIDLSSESIDNSVYFCDTMNMLCTECDPDKLEMNIDVESIFGIQIDVTTPGNIEIESLIIYNNSNFRIIDNFCVINNGICSSVININSSFNFIEFDVHEDSDGYVSKINSSSLCIEVSALMVSIITSSWIYDYNTTKDFVTTQITITLYWGYIKYQCVIQAEITRAYQEYQCFTDAFEMFECDNGHEFASKNYSLHIANNNDRPLSMSSIEIRIINRKIFQQINTFCFNVPSYEGFHGQEKAINNTCIGSKHGGYDVVSVNSKFYPYVYFNFGTLNYSTSEAYMEVELTADICIEVTDKYILVPYEKTWEDAQDYCMSKHGTSLATVITKQDLQEIVTMKNALYGDKDVWIGLKQNTTKECAHLDDAECGWYWVSGASYLGLNDTLWAPGEPNDRVVQEDCGGLLFIHDNLFNDFNCDTTTIFVCDAPVINQNISIPSTTNELSADEISQTDMPTLELTLIIIASVVGLGLVLACSAVAFFVIRSVWTTQQQTYTTLPSGTSQDRSSKTEGWVTEHSSMEMTDMHSHKNSSKAFNVNGSQASNEEKINIMDHSREDSDYDGDSSIYSHNELLKFQMFTICFSLLISGFINRCYIEKQLIIKIKDFLIDANIKQIFFNLTKNNSHFPVEVDLKCIMDQKKYLSPNPFQCNLRAICNVFHQHKHLIFRNIPPNYQLGKMMMNSNELNYELFKCYLKSISNKEIIEFDFNRTNIPIYKNELTVSGWVTFYNRRTKLLKFQCLCIEKSKEKEEPTKSFSNGTITLDSHSY